MIVFVSGNGVPGGISAFTALTAAVASLLKYGPVGVDNASQATGRNAKTNIITVTLNIRSMMRACLIQVVSRSPIGSATCCDVRLADHWNSRPEMFNEDSGRLFKTS
jgi:hypothetical protein